MQIRPERPEELDAIYNLIREAFKTAKVSDGDEQDFAAGLRNSPRYIPELALVAEEDGVLTGHIMLTKTTLTCGGTVREVLLLAPVSVALEHRDRGVGSALIREAMKRALSLGYTSVFLVGDPLYYHRFGFRPAAEFGIRCKGDIPAQYVQACPLQEGALDNAGGGVVEVI